MHIVYIDESKHLQADKTYIYSALCVDVDEWKAVFNHIKSYRVHLRDQYGIYLKKELHASNFVAGKGKISNRVINKQLRAQIYRETIEFLASMGGHHKHFCLFNSINSNEEWAFDRLINRIQRTMQTWDSKAILMFDEGEEVAFRKRIRRMNIFNPIPSQYGFWRGSTSTHRNIVIERIIEDPVFKQSHESYFIQLVDFCAYALMRKERQIESKNALGIHECFDLLEPLCCKLATRNDPMGVIR